MLAECIGYRDIAKNKKLTKVQTTENHQHAKPRPTVVFMSFMVGGVSVQQVTGHQCQEGFSAYYYEGSGILIKV